VVFGPDGIWRELLGLSQDYLGSEVKSEAPAERQYRVRDFWMSHPALERFRQSFAVEYERLSLLMASDRLVDRIEMVGEYYEAGGGGEDVVPA
jgi:hypothetical protein